MKRAVRSTRSDLVETWRSRPIPKTLWHYTSIAGFHGIVTSKKIFATDVRFLNDKEEFTLAAKLVREFIQEAPKSNADAYTSGGLLQGLFSHTFESGIFSAKTFDVFVASFSEAEDELSQWRGYSHGSSGVSLGLNLEKLRPAPSDSDISLDRFKIGFAPCIYEDDLKREFIRDTLSRLTRDVERMLGGAKPGVWNKQQKNLFRKVNSCVEACGTTLFRLSALMKNSAFSEEKEWRLVVPLPSYMQLEAYPRRFRAANTQLIPYIEYPLCLGEAPLPLKDVILGPGSETATAAISAESLLKSLEVTIPPRESKVPFKPW